MNGELKLFARNRNMQIIKYPKKEIWDEILTRPSLDDNFLERTVANILKDVKAHGDEALKHCARHFDKVELDEFLVSKEEFDEAEARVSDELKEAIKIAKANIEKFHTAQTEKSEVIETTKGIFCWRKSVAIEKVGLYISRRNRATFFDGFDAHNSCETRRMPRDYFVFTAE